MKKHASDAEVERLRQALRDFIKARDLVPTTWCKASGVSESSLRWFLAGRTRSMNDATYRKLAANQGVPMSVLRGELPLRVMSVPLRSYVGAGAEIRPFDDDPAFDSVTLPDWSELASEGYMVKGNSMEPMFHDGDVLIPEREATTPDRRIGSVVLLDLKDGRRLVKKLIRGAKKGRWTLISINPEEPAMQDQQVMRVAAIPIVKRRL